jgi:ketosteroid isomerase-like protein
MTDSDSNAIAAIRQALEAAENASNSDAAAALMTNDAVLMVPDFPVQEGKIPCARFLQNVMGWIATQFDRHITYVSAEVTVIGDMAFDRGTFSCTVSPKSGGDSTQVTGKYLWLLRRTPLESWKIARLIVSRNEDSSDAVAEKSDELEAPTYGA